MSEAVPTRRRWLRVRLRTVLVAVSLLCLLLGVIAARAQRQRLAVGRLLELGARPSYDYQPLQNRPAIPSSWLWRMGLVDYFHSVTCVHFDKPLEHDTDLAVLQELPQLGAVFLEETHVSDKALAYLRGLPRLTMVGIGNETATDDAIALLSQLTQLEQLYVGVDCASHVTDAGVAPLAKLTRLKQLWIENSHQISDAGMKRLEGLNLSVLSVRGTRVTYAMSYWERRTPKCTVLYTPVRSQRSRFPQPGDS